MLRAIREIRPRWVVGENVRGLLNWNGGMVFDEVQTDLENEGYEITPFLLPAGGVNAPHRRDRIWFIAFNSANSKSEQSKRLQPEQRKISKPEQREFRRSDCENDVSNSCIERCDNGCDNRQERHFQNDFWITKENKSERNGWKCGACEIGSISTNTDSGRQSSEEHRKEESRQFAKKSFPGYWENFPTQSPVCSGDDGLPTELDGITFPKWRNESIKAAGNAIVPQVALQIFKAIQEYENKFG